MYEIKSRHKMMNALRRHEKWNRALELKLKKYNFIIIKNNADAFAAKINKMYKEVLRDAERARQFSRSSIYGNETLYAEFYSRHRIFDIILDYYKNKFDMQRYILFNKADRTAYILDGENIMILPRTSPENVLSSFGIDPNDPDTCIFMDKNTNDAGKLYETFYKSQYIPERDNPQYFRRMIPQKVEKAYSLDLNAHPRQLRLL